MKKLLFFLFTVISITAFGQSGSLSQSVYRSRVNDSTTVTTPAGYGLLYYNNQRATPAWIFSNDQGATWQELGSGGGGGSGTVNSGTQYRLGYYATTGTAISEAAAITASRALVSDANGVPTHATTTATEIGYINGLTSSAQTQINTVSPIGDQDLYIPAASMWPKTTSGSSELIRTEIATSLINIQTLAFDQTTQEYAQFNISLPRNYNNSTVTIKFYWTGTAGTGDVVWSAAGVALGNDEALTTTFGTAQTATDTYITANDVHISSYTSAITIANTPADSDIVFFEISRDADNGSDTYTSDALLLGISISLTLDAAKTN